MNVLIIEDELLAADKLERLLKRYDSTISVVERCDSVIDSTTWLSSHHQEIDLIFLDIHLTDGLSFEIFERIKIETPIIFTTAYNQYALNAFKLNSIDYLLKPITFDDLHSSMKKLEGLQKALSKEDSAPTLKDLGQFISSLQNNYKNRFMVKIGERLHSFRDDQIALFYAEGRTVFLLQDQGKHYIIDYKMEELEQLLDPSKFFRISRSFIVHINAIQGVILHSNSRLKINLIPQQERDLIVSREKVNSFKEWFNGNTNK